MKSRRPTKGVEFCEQKPPLRQAKWPKQRKPTTWMRQKQQLEKMKAPARPATMSIVSSCPIRPIKFKAR